MLNNKYKNNARVAETAVDRSSFLISGPSASADRWADSFLAHSNTVLPVGKHLIQAELSDSRDFRLNWQKTLLCETGATNYQAGGTPRPALKVLQR